MSRIPLSTDLKTRTGAPDKDARLKNCYVEVRGESSAVRRRPSAQGGVAVGSGTAQGGIDNDSKAYAIFGDVLKSYDSAYSLVDNITL